MSAHDFHLGLARDAAESAAEQVRFLARVSVPAPAQAHQRTHALRSARLWLGCAKKNLALAEAALRRRSRRRRVS